MAAKNSMTALATAIITMVVFAVCIVAVYVSKPQTPVQFLNRFFLDRLSTPQYDEIAESPPRGSGTTATSQLYFVWTSEPSNMQTIDAMGISMQMIMAQTVKVTGTIEDTLGPNILIVRDDGYFMGKDLLVIQSHVPMAQSPGMDGTSVAKPGDRVVIQGTVTIWDPSLKHRLQDQGAVPANSIEMLNSREGDAMILVEKDYSYISH